MDILERIALRKKKEIALLKSQTKISTLISSLEKSPYFEGKTHSLEQRLQDKNSVGIIAEFKRKSPSKGWINQEAKTEKIIPLYERAGAAGISILTDTHFFGGSIEDIIKIRKEVHIPILRKEFIVDEFQIVQTKAIGADAVLLIAECLSKKEIKKFSKLARSLGLEVLMEIHSEEMLEKINEHINIIGINNRNLKTFEVNIEQSIHLYSKIPDTFTKISESGFSTTAEIRMLREVGFDGFLIGENFMKTSSPGETCSRFIKVL